MPEPALPSPTPRHTLVAAPRDYFIGPVFAATKQATSRQVTIGDRRYQIGGFHPLDAMKRPPALDVRHARAIFTLLSFRDPFEETRMVRFSMNEFCRRYARTNGGRYSRDIRRIFGDLLDTYIRIQDVETNIAHSYRLIERVHIEERPIRRKDDKRAENPQLELWFNVITLSEEFYAVMNRIAELHHLKLDVFTGIRSPLAQAIYLYIPSRAHHHTEKKPFEINLTTLLQQVSHPIPEHKSRRHQLFTQHRTSIIAQLDGKETLSGVFRVNLVETADKTDWKLQAWVERTGQGKQPRKLPDSKMVQAFLRSGRTREDLERRLNRIAPLSTYDRDLLKLGKIEVEGNTRFFEMAKALLGETRFEGLLAEAKGYAVEGVKATKSPTARLIFHLMEAAETR